MGRKGKQECGMFCIVKFVLLSLTFSVRIPYCF